MVSCLIQVEWEEDLGESLSKHFESVFTCVLWESWRSKRWEVLFVPKQAASWTVCQII